jgi:predicted nucleic acid-binding Zn ribbon protein
MAKNKFQALTDLLFQIKESSPKGLLFLQQKYGIDLMAGEVPYPELQAVKGYRKFGEQFVSDLVDVAARRYELQYFDWNNFSNKLDGYVSDVGGALEWADDTLGKAQTVTAVIDATIVSDEEKQKAVEKLEQEAEKEALEAEKQKQTNKKLIYTAVGVIVVLTVLVLFFRKKK